MIEFLASKVSKLKAEQYFEVGAPCSFTLSKLNPYTGAHEHLQKYKHIKHTKQERHRYTWFTQFGLRPPRTASPSFSIIQQNEETQPIAKLL